MVGSLTIMTLFMLMFTVLRMLTGDEVASDGSASILGHQLDLDRRTFLSQIGYCPQFDSIIGDLTGREMLRLFARLRGEQNVNFIEAFSF